MAATGETFVLVPSPFLGGFAWRGVADLLSGRGVACSIFDPGVEVLRSPDPYDAIAELAQWEPSGDRIWVAHSGAGGLIPTLLSSSSERDTAVIFVDALLPHPGAAWIDTAPAPLAAMILEKALEGCAPPWPSWFGDRLAALLPSADDRAAFNANAPAVPIAFLESRAPEIDVPAETRVAYLRLSDAYELECAAAEARGWLVRRRDAHHLLALTDPSSVADDLIELRDLLGQRPAARDAV